MEIPDGVGSIEDSRGIVGNGINAHREGYNVLYGDWSAKWWGDPQQKITTAQVSP